MRRKHRTAGETSRICCDDFSKPIIDFSRQADGDVTIADTSIGVKGDSPFTEGQIVSRQDFDEEVAKLEKERKKGRDRELPQELPLRPAGGNEAAVAADV